MKSPVVDTMFVVPFCMHGNYVYGEQCPECEKMAVEDDENAPQDEWRDQKEG